MKITPIKRKGCKNAGWIWDENYQNKLVVPIHPGRPFIYQTPIFSMENVSLKNGVLKKLSFETDYSKIIKPIIKRRRIKNDLGLAQTVTRWIKKTLGL